MCDACKEEDGKEEAVEGRGDVVPTEGQQHDVDRSCKDSSDSLPTNNSLKQFKVGGDTRLSQLAACPH